MKKERTVFIQFTNVANLDYGKLNEKEQNRVYYK